MRQLSGFAFLACGVVLAAGCSDSAPPRAAPAQHPSTTTLEDVQWTLVELDGEALKALSRGPPTLTLASKDKRMSGFAGCNRMMGGYELDGNALKFSAMATTRIACIDVTPEEPLLRALQATASWKVTTNTLELFDATGTVRSRWSVTMIESGR